MVGDDLLSEGLDGVLSVEVVIRVNFSIELGANARESLKVDVSAGMARAISGGSAAVGVAERLTVLAALTFDFFCFA